MLQQRVEIIKRSRLLLIASDESFDRPVVSALYIRREHARRQFPMPPMIGDTFTADPLARARLIGAGALLQIGLLLALHFSFSSQLQDLRS